MEKLKIGVIGLGGISRGHLGAIAGMSDRFELLAAVDPRGSKAASAALVGDKPIFSSDEEMFAEVKGLDAVAVCTPHNIHIRNIRNAVAYGVRGCLVEKPVTTTLADLDEAIELTESKNVKVAVGYILRHNPFFMKIHQMVKSGQYGAPFAVTCRTEQGHPGVWFEDKSWIKSNEGLGRGGSLFSHGCHYVDLMIWMVGRVTRAAKLSTSIAQGDRMEGPDSSFAIFEFDNGGIGHMFSTWGVRHCESVIDYRVYLQDAQLIYDHRYGGKVELAAVLKHGERTPLDTSDVELPVVDQSAGMKNFFLQYHRFYESVVNDVPVVPGMREARESMEAILKAVDANEESRFAVFPERDITLPPFKPID